MIGLIGLPGSGKSTIGRQLARRLQIPWFDSDQVIEQQLGCSIRQYFEHEGEDRFRDVEAAVIDQLTQNEAGVLSTGGGVILRSVNRERLRSRCWVVYLKSTPDELFRRLRHDDKRPMLRVADPLSRLHDLHTQRGSFYLETAHFVIETGRPTVTSLVNTIIMQLELTGLVPPS